MKTPFLLLASFYVSTAIIAQTPNLDWAYRIGGSATADEYIQGHATDLSGNLLTTGYFDATVDFDPSSSTYNLSSTGGTDIFITKVSPSGTLLWAKSIGGGGTGVDRSKTVICDPSGNVYICGLYRNTVDFDPGSGVANRTSNGNADAFVLKLDANGNFIWVKTFGGTGYDNAWKMDVDSDNNLIIVGDFESTVDFDPGTPVVNKTSVGADDNFVVKLNTNGDLTWVKTFGGSGSEISDGLVVDSDDNVYVSGKYQSTVDFDPGTGTHNLTSLGGSDIYILKLNALGNFVWAKTVGSANGDDNTWCSAIDASDNIFIAGHFYWTVDFNPGSGIYNKTSNGNRDAFLLKLDSDGDFVWVNTFGATGELSDERIKSIAVDSEGAVFATGDFRNTIDFDFSPTPKSITALSTSDAFFIKVNSLGSLVFAERLGGVSSSYTLNLGKAVAVDGNNNAFISGTFKGTGDFDPSTGSLMLTSTPNPAFPSATFPDGFTLKFLGTECIASSGSESVEACSYVSPSGQYTYTSTGTYLDTITNAMGCDSVISIDFTYTPSSITTEISESSCDSYTLYDGTIVTNTGVYSHTLTSSMGCDSIININLTINTVNVEAYQSDSSMIAQQADAYQWIDCDNNMPINGATSQIFTATENGSYAAIITQNNCTDTSACMTVNNIGLEENIDRSISIFPNPVKDVLNVTVLNNTTTLKTITITDLLGKTVYKNTGTQTTLDISNFSPGSYILTVTTNSDNTITKQFIKQ
ncbi:MAG: T9SS type A sorting domain-containing protein [Salibacteraceae bacterium]